LAEFSPYAAPTADDIGRQWDDIYASLTVVGLNVGREDVPLAVRVVGEARVTVPAGAFETMKVEAVSKARHWTYGYYSQKLEFWYAPTAKRTVKMVRHLENSISHYSYTDVYELAKYELH
jgi:hypothetical protein